MTDTMNELTSEMLVARFALQHPEYKDAISTSVHAFATHQNRAIFFVPFDALTSGKNYIRIHVHDLTTGQLIDIGSTSYYGDIEHSFLAMVRNYLHDACPSCIMEKDLCDEHRPPEELEIRLTCSQCGSPGHEETYKYVRKCHESCEGNIYACNDCDHEKCL